ncbi:MAG: methylated-DNA--[protein]-cysteine S-methyltransferase [Kiritimatiellaeota bacterium]|nr:methylated-DNA--[protein]-cysteine S-methyltransferase [Kiritimatiellota bacterium]
MKHRAFREMAIGRVGLEEEGGRVTRVWLPGRQPPPGDFDAPETPTLRAAFGELEEYFAGRRKVFGVPLAPRGTPFRMRVWAELRKVGFGERVSYGELARRVGSPQAARAVGGAMHNNPLAIFIPCHRVVGSNGGLTGFAGGLPMKEKLLRIEKKAAATPRA